MGKGFGRMLLSRYRKGGMSVAVAAVRGEHSQRGRWSAERDKVRHVEKM